MTFLWVSEGIPIFYTHFFGKMWGAEHSIFFRHGRCEKKRGLVYFDYKHKKGDLI